jgi:hypothetical protein
MPLPYHFPDPLEEARLRAEEFQRLSVNERLRQLLDTIETGLVLVRESPNRRVNDELFMKRESEWQRIQAELFKTNGK